MPCLIENQYRTPRIGKGWDRMGLQAGENEGRYLAVTCYAIGC